VLVVEDETSLRFAIAKALRKAEFSVLEAADGSAAIDLLRAHTDKVVLILLDLTTPGAPSREVVTPHQHRPLAVLRFPIAMI